MNPIPDGELLTRNQHISTEELLRDIAETEAEISTMAREAAALEQLPNTLPNRWDHMRAQARRSGIEERKTFLTQLHRLLELRQNAAPVTICSCQWDFTKDRIVRPDPNCPVHKSGVAA